MRDISRSPPPRRLVCTLVGAGSIWLSFVPACLSVGCGLFARMHGRRGHAGRESAANITCKIRTARSRSAQGYHFIAEEALRTLQRASIFSGIKSSALRFELSYNRCLHACPWPLAPTHARARMLVCYDGSPISEILHISDRTYHTWDERAKTWTAEQRGRVCRTITYFYCH